MFNQQRVDLSGKGLELLNHVVRHLISGSCVWKNPVGRKEPNLCAP